MSAKGAFSEVPFTAKPGGSAVMRSPWLIHTVWCSPGFQTPSNSADPSSTFTSARPNSRWWPLSTLPPSCSAIIIWP
jgi:hypothetical protein